jgi:putative alpha-1,2-mannosidase
MKKQLVIVILLLSSTVLCLEAQKRPVDYVNPFLGTAPLTNPTDIGFKPPWRVWAGLVFPGASVPNAMVQLTPITKFHTGVGYKYEEIDSYFVNHSDLEAGEKLIITRE